MWLITVYVGLVMVGDIADYLIGLVVEHYWPDASLFVFLFLYMAFLWIGWVLAVRWTAPKDALASAPATAAGQ